MDKSTISKKIWICEECGREHDKLPFPASCKCGNWCEEFFREKDCYDYEDEKAGVPLLGIKYEPEVLRKRNEKLKEMGTEVIQTIEEEEAIPSINFDTMSKIELRGYLQTVGSSKASSQAKQKELVTACKRWVEVDEIW